MYSMDQGATIAVTRTSAWSPHVQGLPMGKNPMPSVGKLLDQTRGILAWKLQKPRLGCLHEARQCLRSFRQVKITSSSIKPSSREKEVRAKCMSEVQEHEAADITAHQHKRPRRCELPASWLAHGFTWHCFQAARC